MDNMRLYDDGKGLTIIPPGQEDNTKDQDGNTFAFDSTNRSIDPENGYMRVADCILSRESVDPYYGYEIPGWKDLGLDPDEIYYVYRPADELEKALPTFQGLPLLIIHQEDSAGDPQKEIRSGAVMNDVRMKGGDMLGSISVMDAEAIQGIESGNRVCLSSAYTYIPVLENGEWHGVPYSIRMTGLHGNHVALVEEGRVKGAIVADEKPKRKGRFMNIVEQAVAKVLGVGGQDESELEKREETAREEFGITDPEQQREYAESDMKLDKLQAEIIKDKMLKKANDMLPDGGRELEMFEEILEAIISEVGDVSEAEDGSDIDERRAEALTGDAKPKVKRSTNKNGVPYVTPGKTAPNFAMDAATIASDAKQAALSELRSVHEAVRDVRSIVGDMDPFSVTSAEQVYKMALDASGFKSSDYPSSAWRGMCHALKAQAEQKLAQDWDINAGQVMDSLPDHLKKVRV